MVEGKEILLSEKEVTSKKKMGQFHDSKVCIYFGVNQTPVVKRMRKLSDEFPMVSVSAIIVASTMACIDDIEKGIRSNKRRFKVNGHVMEI